MAQFDAFRDGKVHVCAKRCKTCIFRPSSPAYQADIIQKAVAKDTAVICHNTLDGPNAVCRGFFDTHKTTPLVLAVAVRKIDFV